MSLPRPPSIFDGADLQAAFARRGAPTPTPTAHNLGSLESHLLEQEVNKMNAKIEWLHSQLVTRDQVRCCPGPRLAGDQDAELSIAGALHYLAQSLKAMEQRQAHTELMFQEHMPGYTRAEIDTIANARHDPCVPRS